MIRILFFNLLLSAWAWADEAGHGATEHAAHGDPHAIPFAEIGVQAFNFFLLFGILVLLLRKPIKAHFTHRANEYHQLVERAEAARREAERSHREIKDRLDKLEGTAEESLVRVQAESEELRKRMIVEAKALSTKLEQEAQRTTQVELEKAKNDLRRELLQSALKSSSEALKSKLGSTDQKKLQNEFVDKIQVVG